MLVRLLVQRKFFVPRRRSVNQSANQSANRSAKLPSRVLPIRIRLRAKSHTSYYTNQLADVQPLGKPCSSLQLARSLAIRIDHQSSYISLISQVALLASRTYRRRIDQSSPYSNTVRTSCHTSLYANLLVRTSSMGSRRFKKPFVQSFVQLAFC